MAGKKKLPAAGAKELAYTGMRRKGTNSGRGHAGYRRKRERPLTDRQKQVLALLLGIEDPWYGMTGNEIGFSLNLSGPMAYKGWHGTARMGPAQRVIGTLNGLSKRGLVDLAPRRDGRSGTAYGLTEKGREIAMEQAKDPSGVKSADPDEKRVWTVPGYDFEDSLDPIRAGDVTHAPGSTVVIDDEHPLYPGEEGIVQAVGMGQGMIYAGRATYDVLVEGADEAERFSEHELSV